ncbi:MAG: Uma2 family endonuclease [Acaryochloridaceae cyanobacterium RU_4_10]|nr:Uma2 family endonuclease [Acaryochloridaceae cyanobacterium RU_4_10]
MVATHPAPEITEIFYPSSDGEPLAETSVHVDAIIHAVVALREYLKPQQAIVLADQYLYYAQGFPKLRVAPDVMVIWNVSPGPRDNFKTWEEGSIPAVIFEMTSEGTRNQDQDYKKTLYEQMEVKEYWLFDPKGEWIPEQLRGYRLQDEQYQPITDSRSEPLQLRLQVDNTLIGFYREDTGEKLLAPSELVAALQKEVQARQDLEKQLAQEQQRTEDERQRADRAETQVRELMERLRLLGVDPNGEG